MKAQSPNHWTTREFPRVIFYIWYEVGVQHHSFACGFLVVTEAFIEKTFIFLLNGLGTIVKSQLSIDVGVYAGTLKYIPFIYICILMPVPLCFDYCSFVVCFEIKNCEGASLVVQRLRICLLMQGTRVRALVWEDPTCRGATRPVSHNY